VVDAAARHGFGCKVRAISWSEVTSADEMFVVNSVIGVWPIRALEGRTYAPGRVTRTVQQWLREDEYVDVA
jgi:4-amino-4-deoxychorismate lyase